MMMPLPLQVSEFGESGAVGISVSLMLFLFGPVVWARGLSGHSFAVWASRTPSLV